MPRLNEAVNLSVVELCHPDWVISLFWLISNYLIHVGFSCKVRVYRHGIILVKWFHLCQLCNCNNFIKDIGSTRWRFVVFTSCRILSPITVIASFIYFCSLESHKDLIRLCISFVGLHCGLWIDHSVDMMHYRASACKCLKMMVVLAKFTDLLSKSRLTWRLLAMLHLTDWLHSLCTNTVMRLTAECDNRKLHMNYSKTTVKLIAKYM